MCYPAPGPRCSGHARQSLEKKKAAFATADEKFIANAREYAGDDDQTFTARNAELLRKVSQAQEEVSIAQNAFDSTLAGQSELKDKINAEPEDSDHRKVLIDRLRIGRETRSRQTKAIGADVVYASVTTRDLRAGDVLVGSGFIVSRAPYNSVGQAKGRMWVEGRYPNDTQNFRREWSARSNFKVDRDNLSDVEQSLPAVEKDLTPAF